MKIRLGHKGLSRAARYVLTAFSVFHSSPNPQMLPETLTPSVLTPLGKALTAYSLLSHHTQVLGQMISMVLSHEPNWLVLVFIRWLE